MSVTTVNATADVSVTLRPYVTDASGVLVEILAVGLESLSGELRFANTSTSLAPYRPAVQTIVTGALRRRAPRIPQASRIVGITPPLRAVLDQPSNGTAYVRLPIRIQAPYSCFIDPTRLPLRQPDQRLMLRLA